MVGGGSEGIQVGFLRVDFGCLREFISRGEIYKYKL